MAQQLVEVTVSFLVQEDEIVEAEDAMKDAFCNMDCLGWGCKVRSKYVTRAPKYARAYFNEYTDGVR